MFNTVEVYSLALCKKIGTGSIHNTMPVSSSRSRSKLSTFICICRIPQPFVNVIFQSPTKCFKANSAKMIRLMMLWDLNSLGFECFYFCNSKRTFVATYIRKMYEQSNNIKTQSITPNLNWHFLITWKSVNKSREILQKWKLFQQNATP